MQATRETNAIGYAASPVNGRAHRGRVRGAWLALVPLFCFTTAACFHETRAWPVPIEAGKEVTVTFAQPRAVGIVNDSALVMSGLRGRVQAFRADTLTVNLTSVKGDLPRSKWNGRVAIFALDSSTTVVRTEFEKGSIPFVVIAAMVGFYAFIGSLPP